MTDQNTIEGFGAFDLPAKLQQSLARMKFTTPTPIQAAAIPLALEGRDILGSAQTGTGKTGAFGIPLIAKLMENRNATALVLTPTRELAQQVLQSLVQMLPVPDIKTALLIGGEPMPRQFRQLQMHPRLIVGTPGRINDHLLRGTLKLNNTGFLVLDETDRMLDMGFGVQLDKIAQYLPAQRQTMMFSATMPQEIVKLAGKYLTKPERISMGDTNVVAPRVKQELMHLTEDQKYPMLLEKLSSTEGTTIIFVKTKYGTERLAKKLVQLEHRADAIHGDLKQARRDKVIRSFRDKKFRILVATDVAARGLDVPHVELVINYDLPQSPEDYIHRVGRTARAGADGAALNLLTPADHEKWRAIHMLMTPNEPLPEEVRGRGQSKGKTRGSSRRRGSQQNSGNGESSRHARAKTRAKYGKQGDDRAEVGYGEEQRRVAARRSDNGSSKPGPRSEGTRSENNRSEGRRYDDRRSDNRRGDDRRSEGGEQQRAAKPYAQKSKTSSANENTTRFSGNDKPWMKKKTASGGAGGARKRDRF